MLLSTQIEFLESFSDAEQAVADYVLSHQEEVIRLSTQELAVRTYTSPASVIRFCQRLGFKGLSEFKQAFSKEVYSYFIPKGQVDINFPFKKGDTPSQIAASLSELVIQTIQETEQLIDYQALSAITELLENSSRICLFGVSRDYLLAQDFQYKLLRIGRHAELCPIPGDDFLFALNMKKGDCALLLSYSGETPLPIQVARLLKEKEIPTAAITSLGNNTLKSLVNHYLSLVSREKSCSKIATFSTEASLQYLLNLLFSCLFERSYQENYAHKSRNDRMIETRKINFEPIQEE